MYISVNSNNEIKKVGIDENLTVLYVDETREDYPWNGWSEAKICCYKVKVNDKGIVTMMTPYIWSNNLEVIDMLGHASEHYADSKKAYLDDTECVFTTNRKGVVTCSCITESGKGIPTTYSIVGNTVIVQFEKLEEVATVSINIQ